MALRKNDLFCGVEKLNQIRRSKEVNHIVTISNQKAVGDSSNYIQEYRNCFVAFNFSSFTEQDEFGTNIDLITIADTTTFSIKDKRSVEYLFTKDLTDEELKSVFVKLIVNYSMWNKLNFKDDPEREKVQYHLSVWGKNQFVLMFKLLAKLSGLSNDEIKRAAIRLVKGVGGKYDSETNDFKEGHEPILRLYSETLKAEFGLLQAIKGGYRLYVWRDRDKKKGYKPLELMMYDMSQFFKTSDLLELGRGYGFDELANIAEIRESEQYKNQILSEKHFNQFSKKTKKDMMHIEGAFTYLVKFMSDFIDETINKFLSEYNKDAHARMFYSTGSVTDVAMATMMEEWERKSASILQFEDSIRTVETDLTEDDIIRYYKLTYSSYSAGFIEQFLVGSFKRVGMVDIRSAYPFVMKELYSLEGANLTTGEEISYKEIKQKQNGKSYVFVDCTVNVENEDTIHTFSVKAQEILRELQSDEFRSTIYPYGQIRATVLLEELDLLLKQEPSALVKIHNWVCIEATSDKKPYSNIVNELWKLRDTKGVKDTPMEVFVKLVLNGIYGKMLQTNKINFEENSEIKFGGKVTNQYFNQVYGSVTCAFTRVRLIEMALELKKKGLPIIMMMTDSVYFDLSKTKEKIEDVVPRQFESLLKHYNDMKYNGWTEERVLGMFSEPEEFTKAKFLSLGFYELFDESINEYKIRTMSLNLSKWDNTKSLFADAVKKTKALRKTKEYKKLGIGEYGEYITFKDYSTTLVTAGEFAENMSEETSWNVLGSKSDMKVEIKYNNVSPKRELKSFLEILKIDDFLSCKKHIETKPRFVNEVTDEFGNTVDNNNLNDFDKEINRDMIFIYKTKRIKNNKKNQKYNDRKKEMIKTYNEYAKANGLKKIVTKPPKANSRTKREDVLVMGQDLKGVDELRELLSEYKLQLPEA